MTGRRALIVVNYRSAALALEAIRTARAASSEPLQVVVVDNSGDGVFDEAADVVLTPPRNLGYAAAINLGRKSCDAEVLIVSNPDVLFAAEAIDRLSDALDERTAVAGPALFWDDAHEWLLPPADLLTARVKLDEALATRSRAWARWRDRRRFARRVAFWSLRETTAVPAISGAVMAIRARDFDEAGGFDERFFLYFEEIDFARRMRKRIVYVPAAKCRHIYNQSGGSSHYAASEREYLRKWGGWWVYRVAQAFQPVPVSPSSSIDLDDLNVVVEASPLPDFSTAAGHFPKQPHVQLPAEVVASLHGPVYLRASRIGAPAAGRLLRGQPARALAGEPPANQPPSRRRSDAD
jgi:GT2 family glycosyltransferase